MRFHQLASVIVVVVLMHSPAAGQEWTDYTSREDRFTVNFPAAPTIRDFTYTSWRDAKLPARIYTVERGSERYSVTVVGYSVAERVHAERVKSCPPGAHSLCFGNDEVSQGVGGWKYDVLGAVEQAVDDIGAAGKTRFNPVFVRCGFP